MKLETGDAKAFYDTMMPLLVWVRQTLVEKAGRGRNHQYPNEREAAILLRALWKRPTLIGEYLEEKKAALSEDAVSVLSDWAHSHVAGLFWIEHFMTTGAVFISVESGQVYLVSGITSEIEESVRKEQLPCLVETAMLPYRGRIIYDSTLIVTPHHMKTNGVNALRKVFRDARNSGRLIKTLPTDISAPDEAQWQAFAIPLLPINSSDMTRVAALQRLEEEGVHMLSEPDLAFLEEMRLKPHRSQRDWDRITGRLADCDLFTATPKKPAGTVKDIEGILYDGKNLLAYTTPKKCEDGIRTLAGKAGNPRNYTVQAVEFDSLLNVAHAHGLSVVIDRTDEPIQMLYEYDGKAECLGISMYFYRD